MEVISGKLIMLPKRSWSEANEFFEWTDYLPIWPEHNVVYEDLINILLIANFLLQLNK